MTQARETCHFHQWNGGAQHCDWEAANSAAKNLREVLIGVSQVVLVCLVSPRGTPWTAFWETCLLEICRGVNLPSTRRRFSGRNFLTRPSPLCWTAVMSQKDGGHWCRLEEFLSISLSFSKMDVYPAETISTYSLLLSSPTASQVIDRLIQKAEIFTCSGGVVVGN